MMFLKKQIKYKQKSELKTSSHAKTSHAVPARAAVMGPLRGPCLNPPPLAGLHLRPAPVALGWKQIVPPAHTHLSAA